MTLTIEVKLSKRGNSLVMTVPRPVVKTLEWNEGDMLKVGVEDGKMIVEKA